MASGTIKSISYKEATFSASGNVAANATTTFNLSGTIPSGYTPIGIIKFETGNTYITVEAATTTYMRVHNNSSLQKSCDAEVIAVCAPTDLVS